MPRNLKNPFTGNNPLQTALNQQQLCGTVNKQWERRLNLPWFAHATRPLKNSLDTHLMKSKHREAYNNNTAKKKWFMRVWQILNSIPNAQHESWQRCRIPVQVCKDYPYEPPRIRSISCLRQAREQHVTTSSVVDLRPSMPRNKNPESAMSNTFGSTSRTDFEDKAGAGEAIPFRQGDTGDRTTNSGPASKHFIQNSTRKHSTRKRIRDQHTDTLTSACDETLHDKDKWVALRSKNSPRSWRPPKNKKS
jgi:hypothetical protein